MATAIKIDKNVPLPESQGKGFSAALRKMKVGESIVIPIDARSSIRTLATRMSKRISIRAMENGTHIRVWLVK